MFLVTHLHIRFHALGILRAAYTPLEAKIDAHNIRKFSVRAYLQCRPMHLREHMM